LVGADGGAVVVALRAAPLELPPGLPPEGRPPAGLLAEAAPPEPATPAVDGLVGFPGVDPPGVGRDGVGSVATDVAP
jgi:hypothetical protein